MIELIGQWLAGKSGDGQRDLVELEQRVEIVESRVDVLVARMEELESFHKPGAGAATVNDGA